MRWQVTFSEETPGIDLESINHSSQQWVRGPLYSKNPKIPRVLWGMDDHPTTHCKVPGHQLFFVEQIHHIFLQNISNNEDNIAT